MRADRPFWLFLLVPLLGATPARTDDFVVVVNAANPVASLPRSEITRLFLKKSSHWASGAPVLPVDLPPESPVRLSFSRSVLGKSVASVKAYWRQQIFSGRDVPPPEKGSEAEALDYVRANAAGVAYVSAGAALGRGVHSVAVIDQ